MNLARFKSLEPCGRNHMVKLMEGAVEKIEIFVEGVEPQLFSQIKIAKEVELYLTTSVKPLQKAGDYFTQFCQKVLYESMDIEVDPQDFRNTAIGKRCCKVIIGFITFILIFYPLTNLAKSALFFLISLTSWIMYQVYQHKIPIEISQIKRRTQFKILNDLELAHLPSLYIIDDDKIFIGNNLWQSGSQDEFYEVASFEERVALKLIYREYANAQAVIEEEAIIAHYLQMSDWSQ